MFGDITSAKTCNYFVQIGMEIGVDIAERMENVGGDDTTNSNLESFFKANDGFGIL